MTSLFHLKELKKNNLWLSEKNWKSALLSDTNKPRKKCRLTNLKKKMRRGLLSDSNNFRKNGDSLMQTNWIKTGKIPTERTLTGDCLYSALSYSESSKYFEGYESWMFHLITFFMWTLQNSEGTWRIDYCLQKMHRVTWGQILDKAVCWCTQERQKHTYLPSSTIWK